MSSVKRKSGLGWAIFWSVFFWPVGMFLMIKKFNDKSILIGELESKILTIVGWILLVFGSVFALSTFIDITEYFQLMRIFLSWAIAGGLTLLKIRKVKDKLKKYNLYLDIIVNVGVLNLDTIASSMSVSYIDAQRTIQAMIEEGFIKNAYIHDGKRMIIFNYNTKKNSSNYNSQLSDGIIDTPAQPRTVRCASCGANNVVTRGVTTECEYCGTPINFNS